MNTKDPVITDELEYNSANTPEKEYRYAAGQEIDESEKQAYLDKHHAGSLAKFILDYLGNNELPILEANLIKVMDGHEGNGPIVGSVVLYSMHGCLLEGAEQLSIDNGLRGVK